MRICIAYCLLVFMFSCTLKEQESNKEIRKSEEIPVVFVGKEGAAVNDSSEGRHKFAIINDLDGYTNIRSEEDKNARVIDRLKKGEFFRCLGYKEGKEWQKVSIYTHEGYIVGYIHSSRVKLVEELGLIEQKKVIQGVLEKHDQLIKKSYEVELINSKDNRQEIEAFDENQYSPALSILPNYFCQTRDEELLLLFFEALLYSTASCNEEPSYSIGECYICQPEMVLSRLCQYGGEKEKEVIFNNIDFGLLNLIDSKDKKMKKLQVKLYEMKKKCL